MKKTVGILVCALLIFIAFIPVSNAINVENKMFVDDTTELDVKVTWETYKENGKWYVTFICESSKTLDRIEVYINDELMEAIVGPGPYGYTIEWSKAMKFCTFKFVFYALGGETATVIIDGSDIKYVSYSQQSYYVSINQDAVNFEQQNAPLDIGNNPPETPDINGPRRGHPGQELEYTVVSTDPEGDDIIYCFKWGDGSGGICIGPFTSGEPTTISHTWVEEGTYTMEVNASDIYGAESDVATLTISIPRNRPSIFRLSEIFPDTFSILRQLMGQ